MYPPKKKPNKPVYPAQTQRPNPLYPTSQRPPFNNNIRAGRPLSPRYRDISNSKDNRKPPMNFSKNNRPNTGVFGSSMNPVNNKSQTGLSRYQKTTSNSQFLSAMTQTGSIFQKAPSNQFKKYLDDS